MIKFQGCLGDTAVELGSAFIHLLADPQQRNDGGKAVLLIGALYTLMVIGCVLWKAAISNPAWIAIPAEDYYFRKIFVMVPVFLLAWMLATGLTQILIRPFQGRGTFESALAVLGFALTLPVFVTWIVETILAALMLEGAMKPGEWQRMAVSPELWPVLSWGYPLLALV